MRGSNSREKCKRRSSPEIEVTQKDEIPGVDYKAKLGPRSQRHNKLDLNKDEGEARFLNSVRKELSKKENVRKIQTAFQGDTTLASKSVCATNQYMSFHLNSPLDGISLPGNVEKYKNPGLIKDIPLTVEEEDEVSMGNSPAQHVRPTVLGVNMKWRNGVELKQIHKFTTKLIYLEPVMRKTEFDFETKTKFNAQVEEAVEELFPEGGSKLMVLDGNLSKATPSVTRSDNLKEDESPSAPTAGTGAGNPYAREWREFTDLEEHKVLVIPTYGRNGFDLDLQRKYEFTYQAKFVIGRKAYHHKFIVQVPLSKAPQHYGLIFTFSEDQKGHSKLRIKSLLTVYSILPVSSKFASLETYEKNNLDDNNRGSPLARKKKPNDSAKEAKKAVELVTENLREANLMTSSWDSNNFHMDRNLSQPANDCFRYRRLYNDGRYPGKKENKKKNFDIKNAMD